jgi:hypothetical protein
VLTTFATLRRPLSRVDTAATALVTSRSYEFCRPVDVPALWRVVWPSKYSFQTGKSNLIFTENSRRFGSAAQYLLIRPVDCSNTNTSSWFAVGTAECTTGRVTVTTYVADAYTDKVLLVVTMFYFYIPTEI